MLVLLLLNIGNVNTNIVVIQHTIKVIIIKYINLLEKMVVGIIGK